MGLAMTKEAQFVQKLLLEQSEGLLTETEIKSDLVLDEYFDSLDRMEIIIKCEQEFGIEIDLKNEWRNIKTVDDLVNCISSILTEVYKVENGQ